MNLNDKFFNNNSIKNKENLIALNFNDFNISNISLTFKFNNVEFLSLKNNSIINLKFLEFFPNLFYLDISNNPIEKFNLLNIYNTFGFLSFNSPSKYLEKNFLFIKDLNVGILSIKIHDKNIENNFLLNNPNILLYNNNLFSFEEKFNLHILNKKKLNNNNEIKKNNSNLNSISTSFLSNSLNSPNKKIINNNNNENDKNKNIIHKITNKKSLELINFFEDYNNIINNCFKNKEKNNFLNYNNKQLILSYEYKKIYFISQINHYIQNLIKENIYYSPNNLKINSINTNIFKLINIENQIFLISLLFLYIFGLISFNLIFQILSNFYYKNSIKKDFENIKNEIKNLLNLKNLYLIIEYTNLYKHLKTLDIKNKEFLISIISSLNILKLSNEIMKIIENCNININVYSFKNNILEKKIYIKDKIIKFLHEIKIIKETICIINYVIDYMLNKEYDKIIFEKFSNEYQIFLEIKNHLINYYSSKENKNESISDILYNDFQIKHLRNKYFFKNNKIKKYKQNTFNVLLNHKKMLFSNKKKHSKFNSFDKYEIQIIKNNKKIEKDLLKHIKILKDKKNFFVTNKKIGNDDNKKNNSFNININNNKETMDNTSELLFYKQNYLNINKINSNIKNKININNFNKHFCNLSDNFSKSMSNIKNNHRPKFPFFEQYENNFKILNKKENKKFSIDCYNKNINNSFSINSNKSLNNVNEYINNNNNNFIINKHLKCKINIKNMILMKNKSLINNNNKLYFLKKNNLPGLLYNKRIKYNKSNYDSHINSLLSKSNSLINSVNDCII